MKKLLSSNKKFIIIPIFAIIGYIFLPLVLAAIIVWLIQIKVKTKWARLFSLVGVFLFTIFFGSAWVDALLIPSDPNTTTSQTEQSPTSDSSKIDTTNQLKTATPSSSIETENDLDTSRFGLAKVVAVIDGDTIDVDVGEGIIKRLRYIGIDAPESVDPSKPVECFSKDSFIKNKELVNGQFVRLEKDKSETDRYGRLLRYVYIGDLFVNQVLVAEGYAESSSYPPDTKYQTILDSAELEAKNTSNGMWKMCNFQSSPSPKVITPSSTNVQIQKNNSGSGTCKYSCTSPDRDCSDFSSHAEAQTFFNCCGFSAENDPMKLDAVGVGDGIACENI